MYHNRSFNDLLGVLQKQKADIVLNNLAIMYERLLAVDFTFPCQKSYTVWYRQKILTNTIDSILQLFSSIAWSTICTCILFSTINLYFENWLHINKCNLQNVHTSMSKFLFIVLGLVVNQSTDFQPVTRFQHCIL